jgi:hypothetical protein
MKGPAKEVSYLLLKILRLFLASVRFCFLELRRFTYLQDGYPNNDNIRDIIPGAEVLSKDLTLLSDVVSSVPFVMFLLQTMNTTRSICPARSKIKCDEQTDS